MNLEPYYEFGAIAAAIIGGFVTWFFPSIKKIITPKCGDRDLPSSFNWDIHSIVHELLTELRVTTDSARTQIVQFHNTGEFVDGISMKKITCTHESLNSGVSGQGGMLKDQMITMFLPLINKVKANDPELHIVSENDETYCKQFMDSSSVIGFSVLPIRNSAWIVGYVMIQWCSWSKVDEINKDKVKEEILSIRDQIEVHLNRQSKKL
tara:strand:+ start:4965 stop:5588 length:624 start_codon:yes stop_codon:yes gene_type:complete